MITDDTEKKEQRKKKIKQADYDVGYGKPPGDTKFKPGKSGNGKGRPKGSKGLKAIVCKAAETQEEYTAKGKKKKGARIEIAYHQVGIKAAKGDLKATQMLSNAYAIYGPAPEPDGADIDPVADAKMIEEYFAHLQKFGKQQGSEK